MDKTASAKQVKEDIGEMFLNRIEDFSSLEAKKVALALSATVAFLFLIKPVIDNIGKWSDAYGLGRVLPAPLKEQSVQSVRVVSMPQQARAPQRLVQV